MNQLEAIKQFTTIVADTGDIESIEAYQPQDATTNPSLIYQASQQKKYAPLIAESVKNAKNYSNRDLLENVLDEISVAIGSEILKIIPGRISTEVDARLSFDVNGSYQKAKKIKQSVQKFMWLKNEKLFKDGLESSRITQQISTL